MTDQMWWIVILGVLAAGGIGFLAGRLTGNAKKRVSELEEELSRQKNELDGYRGEVETHLSETARLFVAMAGDYKDLFEHLKRGHDRLSTGPARERFKEQVNALLLGGSAAAAGATAAAAQDDYPREDYEQYDDLPVDADTAVAEDTGDDDRKTASPADADADADDDTNAAALTEEQEVGEKRGDTTAAQGETPVDATDAPDKDAAASADESVTTTPDEPNRDDEQPKPPSGTAA